MSNQLPPPSYLALQQAADWYSQLMDTEPPADDIHHQWSNWLNASEENRRAWHYVQTVIQRFEPLQGAPHQPAANILLQPSSRRRVLKLAGLSVSGALLSWLTYRHSPLRETLLAATADYHSATGEIKHLTLSDGTQVWLNTASSINVHYDEQHRHIILLSGDVLINTAPNTRPFFVSSPQGQMQALGTRFSVEQRSEITLLTVYAGTVKITALRASKPRLVSAGKQFGFNLNGEGIVTTNSQSDILWTRGMLQADNMPLGEVIAQLSRYRRGYLSCAPEITNLRVVGAFPLSDTDKALAMLEQTFPIQIHRRFSWWVTVEKR
ncbi:FecR domain-containing protein [Serratia nevei]|uniref:FecR domain-containing protein n=1 Tax=Serratia nevei TaxID=2703794 RepID=UPI003FA7B1BA